MIDEKRILETYRKGTPEERELLMRLMDPGFIEEHITDLIQSYDDAVKMVGSKIPASTLGILPENIQAAYKLEVITAALNNGWRHPQDGKTWVYYPWGYLYTKKEIEKLSEEDKKDCTLVLLGGVACDGAYCGLACVDSDNAFSYSDVTFGSRLAYKSRELCEYSIKQFRELWNEYLFYLPKPDEEKADK